MNAYVGMANSFPASRTPRRFPRVSSTTKPTQSHVVHVARQFATRSVRQARNSNASTSTAQITTSSPRTNGATTAATIVPAIHQRVGRRSVRPQPRRIRIIFNRFSSR